MRKANRAWITAQCVKLLPSSGSYPKGCNNDVQARPGAPFGPSTWVPGAQALGPSSAASPVALARSYIGSSTTENLISTHMGYQHYRQQFNVLCYTTALVLCVLITGLLFLISTVLVIISMSQSSAKIKVFFSMLSQCLKTLVSSL